MTTEPRPSRGARMRSAGESFTTDWAAFINRLLLQVAELLEQVGPERWDEPAIQEGWTIRDVAGLLLWRHGTPPAERVRAYSRRMISQPGAIMREQARLAAVDDLPGALRATVTTRAAAPRRGSLPSLSVAVLGAIEIATALSADLELDPLVTEAVGTARALAAPVAVRTVLRRATLRAVDHGWEVGRGPLTASTAAAVLLFLYGHTGPPEPMVSGDAETAHRP